jgi:hypothetical protein
MSKPTRFMLSQLIGLAALVSCTDRPGPTDAEQPTSFGFINGPAEPGKDGISGIFRVRDLFFVGIFDFSTGLAAFIGIESTIADLCDEDEVDAGEIKFADIQVKSHELGEVNSLILARDAAVQILAIPEDFQGEDLCADFAGEPVLYSGTGSIQRTDNNLTESGTEGGRANSFGWTSQGQVTDASGNRLRYNGEVRLLVSPNDEFKVIVSKLRVG